MKKKGEIIDLGIDGVTAEKSADGQQRVLIKIQKPMLEGEIGSTTYRRGQILKLDQQGIGSRRGYLIGCTISDHDGARLVILQSTRGAYVNVDLTHSKLKRLLRIIADEMLDFSEEFDLILQRRAQLMEILSGDPSSPTNP